MPKSPPHKKYGIIAVAAAVAIVVSFLFAAKGTLDRRRAASDLNAQLVAAQKAGDKSACLRINHVYRVIQAQLRVSLTTTPKLAYYKQHPAELRRVLRNTRNEIQAFAPEHC